MGSVSTDEVESVVSFLRRSEKGRLSYDRDWAESRDGVDRVLQELNQLNLDTSGSGSERTPLKLSPDRPDLKEPSPDRSPLKVPSPDRSPLKVPSPDSFLMKKPSPDRSPLKELSPHNTSLSTVYTNYLVTKKCIGSPRDRTIHGPATPDQGIYPLDRSSSVLLTSTPDGYSSTPDKFFGVRPVKVCVNRSTEINMDNSKQFVLNSSLSSQMNSSLLEETENSSFTEISRMDSSMFMYSQGFLKKVSNTPVSVDLVRLRLETVNRLLGLDEDGETESETESEEEPAPDPVSLEIDEKLLNLRVRMEREMERKNAEIYRRFQKNSIELAEVAERRYKEEVETERLVVKLEEEKVLAEIRRDRAEALLRAEKEDEADLQRRKEVEELLRACREQEQREQRIKDQTARLEQVLPCLKSSIMNLLEMWSSVADKSSFSEESRQAVNVHSDFSRLVDTVRSKVKDGDATEAIWKELGDLEQRINDSAQILKEDIVAMEQTAKEAEKAKETEAAQAAAEAARLKEEQDRTKLGERDDKAATTTEESTASIPPPENQQVAPATLPLAAVEPRKTMVKPDDLDSPEKFYHDIINFKTAYVEGIVFTDEEKNIKSELTRAISTAINATSAQTQEHLNDKLEKLTLLLAGRPVTMRDAQICADNHGFGVKYCMALLAKKIVRQGEEVVSSKAEAAFPFASISLALWDTFPEFGKLLLAYLFEFCPFLAPYYPRVKAGSTEKDLYLAWGYKYENDVIEKQDKYLKRMTGLARLFSAISCSSKPQGAGSTHPFGLNRMWQFLANLMNVDPLPDVTATILLVILETTGNLMFIKYRSQFTKLLVFIKETYLPRLEAVKTDGGPTVRLQTFLVKALNSKKFESPRGVLAPGFIKKVKL